jgi:hypothetical protein
LGRFLAGDEAKTESYLGLQAARVLPIINGLVLCGLAGHIYYIMKNTNATFYGVCRVDNAD